MSATLVTRYVEGNLMKPYRLHYALVDGAEYVCDFATAEQARAYVTTDMVDWSVFEKRAMYAARGRVIYSSDEIGK